MRSNLLVFFAAVSSVNSATSNLVIPKDRVGQEKLWNETVQAIFKFRDEFDPNLYQAEDGDAFLTMPQVIARYGYPIEVHDITTEDGYILEAHRIPHGLTCGPVEEGAPAKPVVWLQHGLTGDSSNWIITGNKNRGLGFALADACYDVWMGNYRGNTYSKRHTTLFPNQTEFWDFSWHDLGMYDIPASIDYVLAQTKAASLYYIGHSMGCTAFFVTMSEKPEYNDKVILMTALAPAIFMSQATSPLMRFLIELVLPIIHQGPYIEVFPIEWTKQLAAELCRTGSPNQSLCVLIISLISGPNPAQMDLESLPAIVGHSPAGSSTKTFFHYGQGMISGQFEHFDYNEGNPAKYNGSIVPPKYDLKKITTPIAIYYGDNDALANHEDVLRASREFKDGTLVNLHRVDDPLFGHLDFVIALDQGSLVNDPVMKFMEEFVPNVPTTTDGGVGSVHRTIWICVMVAVPFFIAYIM